MENNQTIIEIDVPFAQSKIWQLNRDYYQSQGIDAWREDDVPSHLTTNSMVGLTYANLILAFMKDLAYQGITQETIYLLELGAGQGRLAFHILKHLSEFINGYGQELPKFCYILSDIVEANLQFFMDHPQFKPYFKSGMLDVCFFDGISSEKLELRYQKTTIGRDDLKQPLVVIANYFFDSIPSDLYFIQDGKITPCSATLTGNADTNTRENLNDLKVSYNRINSLPPFYENDDHNAIINEYSNNLAHTFLLFPEMGLKCLQAVNKLSDSGVFLLSMDKGFHEFQDLDKSPEPELITHGSASFWVNFHALAAYCDRQGGRSFLPKNTSFNLELVCLLFTKDHINFTETAMAYTQFVDNFGPDDFNTLKKWSFKHIGTISLKEWNAILRLSAYDSIMFIALLPRLKQLYKEVTLHERRRIAQTLHKTWNMYFALNESFDLAFSMGGIFYDLGYFEDAITFFERSMALFGASADTQYNIAICLYQLRQDEKFKILVKNIKIKFPDFTKIGELTDLDLTEV